MTKIYFSEKTKGFTRKVFKSLLDFAYLDEGQRDRAIGCEWVVTDKTIKFKLSKTQLQDLYGGLHSEKTFNNEIRPAISEYLPKVLGVIKDMKFCKDLRTFELHLWEDNQEGNLSRFDREWDSKAKESNSQKDQLYTKKSVKGGQGINWLTKGIELFEEHQERLSSNLLQDIKPKHFKDVYVPLGLVERQTKERPQIDRDFDLVPDRDSELNQVETKTTPVKHCDFMKAVIDRQPGEHIVILGEPGAGKTTLLTSVWQSILENNANSETPTIVIWVPLAGLGDLTLKKYVEESWIEQNCEDKDKQVYLESLTSLREAGRLCLLLDGADEIGGDGLQKIYKYLDSKWAKTIKSVVTCRLNLWDGSGQNELKQNFQIFRTLEFRYGNSSGADEVEEFILKWFDNADAGKNLRTALEETGKERIKYLAQNPLRLTLLCNIWQRGESLPDTQAGLYKKFVKYQYQSSQVPDVMEQQLELDIVMGTLAKHGINKPSLRFRFTEMELQMQVADLNHRKILKKLNWLNFLGADETGEEVYAFLHPTFQEYFAACDIEQWNYFLPEVDEDRLVTRPDEIMPTYRVFEKQWQHVILFWIGRHDIRDNCKNEFVEKLTQFKEMAFYDVQAYCIAATCTSEFIDFHKSKDIVAKIVEWAFGYLTEEKEWQQPVEPIESLAKATIPFIHRGHAIEILMSLLLDSDHTDNNPLSGIADVLGKITVGNKAAINRLFELIEQKSSQYNLRILSQLLGNILIGSQEEIDRLIKLLNDNDLDTWLRGNLVEALGKISIGNKGAIDSLVRILNEENLYSYFHIKIIYTLGDIAIQNEVDIMVLLQILERDNLHGDVTHLTHSISSTLSKIAVGNDLAIDKIVEILNNGNLDDKINYRSSVEILGKIGAGKQAAISALVRTFNKETLAGELRCLALQELGIIATGNEEAITALIQSLSNENLDSDFQHKILRILSEIAIESQVTINFLIEILKKENINDYLRSNIALTLFRVNKGSKEAINVLGKILNKDDLDDSLYFYVVCILLEIDGHDDRAIKALLKLLKKLDELPCKLCYDVLCLIEDYNINSQEIVDYLLPFIGIKDLGHNLYFVIANILSKIAVGNQTVIRHLLGLLEHQKFEYTSLEILRKIAIGDSNAVDILVGLIQLLSQDSVDDKFRSHVVITLEKIVKKETMPSVILNLKIHITEEICKSNFSLFHDCYQILFYCAQTLSYPEFYDLWHQKTNILSEHS
jgi:HEAT repeat protein/energy-coupling factor transporter ATP-binding protein EcfA2